MLGHKSFDLLCRWCRSQLSMCLRTKQQLGYSVGSSLRLTHGLLGFSFHITSGERLHMLM